MKTNNKQKVYRILILSGIMLLYIVTFANANTTIKGRILTDSNQPVEHATATILSTNSMNIIEGDMCNENGDFIIENVEPGEYILSLRQVGCDKNETRKITVDENNQIVDLKTLVLKTSNIQLPELEVVAAHKKQSNCKKKNLKTLV